VVGTKTQSAGFVSALTEIEYRAWWLEQELGDRGTLDAELAEELAGIREAVERERGLHQHLADRLEALGDRLDEAIRRAHEWMSAYDRRRQGELLRLVPARDEEGRESDGP